MTEYLKVGRHDVKVTHPDKVLFPKAKLTKRDLAEHYERVAPVMLPYVKRPAARAAGVPGRDRSATASSSRRCRPTSPTGSSA